MYSESWEDADPPFCPMRDMWARSFEMTAPPIFPIFEYCSGECDDPPALAMRALVSGDTTAVPRFKIL